MPTTLPNYIAAMVVIYAFCSSAIAQALPPPSPDDITGLARFDW